ncbi:RNA 2',3'-cyclic phosphodiesterase [Emcibacter nanhaiensis]|uniref:RNA 2',3'-cyclic phosphodiesterase n=1 Tax=Emcibacter nanhaiensis TaxID=1505037 RepID=A0A501PQI4_9PROT|nr:RNA 2',3'-cyclic phosphodiesterase [Emcibacter nanhaiensis]TPD62790.1 RNA 2',3'-cyclic phosphodiesterase [Emcibacter nanhaiensis]
MTDKENEKAYQRLFIAIRPDDDVVKSLRRVCGNLKKDKAFENVRWMRPENLHVTLAFLGRQSADDVEQIVAAMAEVSAGHTSFDMEISGLTSVRNSWHKGVIIARVLENESLMTLQRDLVEVLSGRGIEGLDNRKYMPHVTLARLKTEKISQDRLSAVGFSLRQQVTTMELYESVTLQSGAVYTMLNSVHLGRKD